MSVTEFGRRVFGGRFARRATPWAALLLAAVFAMPSAAALSTHSAPVLTPALGTAVGASPLSVATSHPVLASNLAPLRPHIPSAGPVSSGRGTFFSTAGIPNPPTGSVPCLSNYFGSTTCANTTNDPSLNYTTSGLLAVAYTAYTNVSQCANVTNYTFAQVGFASSADNGNTWTTPTYLGNPDCNVASNYPNAWTPSLTSLPNGTLVLTYIEFNKTKYAQIPSGFSGSGWGPYSWSVPFDRLVLTESYDNGVAWTTPQVLNSSNNPGLNASAFAPLRPWVTATGLTVYVTWMNDSKDAYYSTVGSAGVHMRVSTDGGVTWGSQIDLKSVGTASGQFSFNPTVTIGSAGEVVVSYGTNITYDSTNFSYAADVEIATSANNGTSFSYVVAAKGVGYVSYRNPFHDPSPQVAYAAATGQLILTYSANENVLICYSYGCYTQQENQVYVANSSDGGATWSTSHIVAPELSNTAVGWQLYNPSVAVGPTGTVYAEMSYVNFSLCGPYVYGSACGEQSQVFAWSNDNGSSFSSAVQISSNMTVLPYYPDGEYDTLVVVGGAVYVGWTLDVCLNPTVYYCNWPGYPGNGVTEVQVSTLFQGAGWDLNFTESGLQAGTPWSVNVLGNVRSALSPTPLQITGIPTGANITWILNNPAAGYGIRYFGALSLLPPAVITANTTVTDSFSEQVLVNVTSVPNIPGTATYTYCGTLVWDNPYCAMINYNITPTPGANWVAVGASITLNVTNNSQYCYTAGCYFQELNLSFESWTGNGAGSSNTSSNLTSVTAYGPINESANFDLTGWCTVERYVPFYSYDTCWKQNSSVSFHETGLPLGQNWTVSVQGSGNVTTISSNTTWIYVSGKATSKIAYYYVWTIPAGAGEYWIGTGSPGSPIELPTDAIVNVQFVRELPSAAIFPLFINQSGLPTGTPWSLSIGGNGYGVLGNGTSFALVGGNYQFNASPVYLANGTAYYANLIGTAPLVLNATPRSYATPATVGIDGPTLATFNFTPAYYLTVATGTGGTVNVTSQWIQQGRSLHLNATPAADYSFVGWTGSGVGAVNSSRTAITVTPGGPVSEFAAFVHLPPTTWTVHVQETGLPSTLAYSLGLGGLAYTGNGSFNVNGLATGNYTLQVGYVYLNSSNLTRYIPSVTSVSFVKTGAGALEIGADGYVNLSFAPQYLLTLASTANGTISPLPGTYWESPTTTIPLTATPDTHYRFTGWNGSGVGAIQSTTRSVSLQLGGPVWETAQFLWAPNAPPQTFNLMVQESGLPGQATWLATVGTTGVHGSGTGLTITGLNGSYTVVIPPVYTAPGTRYVANVTSVTATFTVPVLTNNSLTVSFTEQFLVTIASGSGGTASATPTAEGWVTSGGSITLSAVANATSTFANWTGAGTGAYTGTTASTPVTVTGPITETATFVPNYPVKSTGSSTAGAPLALGLVAVLAVVGLVVGYVLFRRRSSPPAASTSADSTPTEGESDPADDAGSP